MFTNFGHNLASHDTHTPQQSVLPALVSRLMAVQDVPP